MTEEQKARIIEERAKKMNPVTWELSGEESKRYFVTEATEQLDWFRSHGLDIPEKYVEAHIPDLAIINEESDRRELQLRKAAYNRAIIEIKCRNPNGLYTKE